MTVFHFTSTTATRAARAAAPAVTGYRGVIPRTSYRAFVMSMPRALAQKGYGDDAATKAAMTDSMNKAADAEGGGAKQQQKKTKESTSSSSANDKAAGDSKIAEAAGRAGGEALRGPQGKGKPSPKIHNQALPGLAREGLSEEQKREVERHNEEFEKRHDRAAPAAEDKVDKNFWQKR